MRFWNIKLIDDELASVTRIIYVIEHSLIFN